jgi:hypothetical protein
LDGRRGENMDCLEKGSSANPSFFSSKGDVVVVDAAEVEIVEASVELKSAALGSRGIVVVVLNAMEDADGKERDVLNIPSLLVPLLLILSGKESGASSAPSLLFIMLFIL